MLLPLSALIICISMTLIRSGQITGTEPILDFSNSGYMSKISLKFQLDTALTESDFIKIIFPFPLHSDLTAAYIRHNTLSIPSEL